MAGMLALLTERLKRCVKYNIPSGPRCLRWIAVIPLGPQAVELLDTLMASIVLAVENRVRFRSSGLFILIYFKRRRDSLSDLCSLILVYCFTKAVAIEEALV